MTWYYQQAGEQRGPVTDSDLEQLFNSGTVRAETLVWRDGMANWSPYSQVKHVPSGSPAMAATLDPGSHVCAECGKVFPSDAVIKFGDRYVCAVCKPIFVQKLKEGAVFSGVMDYAGFWIRFAAKFVDGIILQVASLLLNLVVGIVLKGADPLAVTLVGVAVGMAINAAYSTYFIGKFGATPGKMAAKIRVVNADGSKVSYAKAFARYFAEILSSLILGIGYIMAAFDDEKRALHDRICDTRVIKASPK